MRPAFKFAEQAFAGSGPCALARPPRSLLGAEWELVPMSGDSELGLEGRLLEWWRDFIVGVVDHSYLITLLPLWLTILSYPPAMLAVLAMRRAFAGGGVSTLPVSGRLVRALAPPVYPIGYLRRVSHVGGPTVRGCDDLSTRSVFTISGMNTKVNH
ncbi:hypothetical protein BHE74_00043175 [Ensete ventricosum]|nr:hypothetical protein BHE74_00043175 [Ensete ventricosum]